MEKTPFSTAVVRFQDCDPFGHLNNSRYFDYFLNAREDHLLQFHGFDLFAESGRTGTAWVVVRHEIAYANPARLRETVRIESRLVGLTWKTLQVEMTMWNEERSALKALLRTTFAHVRQDSGKTEPHTQAQMAFFESILDASGEDNFEDRKSALFKGVRTS